MENQVPKKLSEEAEAQFRLGIEFLLSRWGNVYMAVNQQWGGVDSRKKVEKVPDAILSLFRQATEPVDVQELDGILYELMLSLNSPGNHSTIYMIADKIVRMHEECLEGKYTLIERLTDANPGPEVKFFLSTI